MEQMDESSNKRKTRSSSRKKHRSASNSKSKKSDGPTSDEKPQDGEQPQTSKETEGASEKSGTSPQQTGSASPEPNCAICLGKLENKSFTDSCFHMFCFVCLVEWSKVKAECPLCKQKFQSIIHNVRSYDDYDQYHIQEQNRNAEAPRFRYSTTLTLERRLMIGFNDGVHSEHDYTLQRPSRISTRSSWRRRRQEATSEFRRRIYLNGYQVSEVSNRRLRYRDITPDFFRRNEAATHRLVPWLNRELNALLYNNQHVQLVLDLIMGLIRSYPINSEEFYQHVYPYVGRFTRHFMHEFETFAKSPYNMAAYDRHAVYQPHSVTIESDSDLSSETDEDDDDVIVISSSAPAPVIPPPLDSHILPTGRPHYNYISPLLESVRSFLEADTPPYARAAPPPPPPLPPPPPPPPPPMPSTGFENNFPAYFSSLSALNEHNQEQILSQIPVPPDNNPMSSSFPGRNTSVIPSMAGPSHRLDIPLPSSSRKDGGIKIEDRLNGSDSDTSDVIFVGYDKPYEERSPVPLSSDSEAEALRDLAFAQKMDAKFSKTSKILKSVATRDKERSSRRSTSRDRGRSKEVSKSSKYSKDYDREKIRHRYRRSRSLSSESSYSVSVSRRRRSRSRSKSADRQYTRTRRRSRSGSSSISRERISYKHKRRSRTKSPIQKKRKEKEPSHKKRRRSRSQSTEVMERNIEKRDKRHKMHHRHKRSRSKSQNPNSRSVSPQYSRKSQHSTSTFAKEPSSRLNSKSTKSVSEKSRNRSRSLSQECQKSKHSQSSQSVHSRQKSRSRTPGSVQTRSRSVTPQPLQSRHSMRSPSPQQITSRNRSETPQPRSSKHKTLPLSPESALSRKTEEIQHRKSRENKDGNDKHKIRSRSNSVDDMFVKSRKSKHKKDKKHKKHSKKHKKHKKSDDDSISVAVSEVGYDELDQRTNQREIYRDETYSRTSSMSASNARYVASAENEDEISYKKHPTGHKKSKKAGKDHEALHVESEAVSGSHRNNYSEVGENYADSSRRKKKKKSSHSGSKRHHENCVEVMDTSDCEYIDQHSHLPSHPEFMDSLPSEDRSRHMPFYIGYQNDQDLFEGSEEGEIDSLDGKMDFMEPLDVGYPVPSVGQSYNTNFPGQIGTNPILIDYEEISSDSDFEISSGHLAKDVNGLHACSAVEVCEIISDDEDIEVLVDNNSQSKDEQEARKRHKEDDRKKSHHSSKKSKKEKSHKDGEKTDKSNRKSKQKQDLPDSRTVIAHTIESEDEISDRRIVIIDGENESDGASVPKSPVSRPFSSIEGRISISDGEIVEEEGTEVAAHNISESQYSQLQDEIDNSGVDYFMGKVSKNVEKDVKRRHKHSKTSKTDSAIGKRKKNRENSGTKNSNSKNENLNTSTEFSRIEIYSGRERWLTKDEEMQSLIAKSTITQSEVCDTSDNYSGTGVRTLKTSNGNEKLSENSNSNEIINKSVDGKSDMRDIDNSKLASGSRSRIEGVNERRYRGSDFSETCVVSSSQRNREDKIRQKDNSSTSSRKGASSSEETKNKIGDYAPEERNNIEYVHEKFDCDIESPDEDDDSVDRDIQSGDRYSQKVAEPQGEIGNIQVGSVDGEDLSENGSNEVAEPPVETENRQVESKNPQDDFSSVDGEDFSEKYLDEVAELPGETENMQIETENPQDDEVSSVDREDMSEKCSDEVVEPRVETENSQDVNSVDAEEMSENSSDEVAEPLVETENCSDEVTKPQVVTDNTQDFSSVSGDGMIENCSNEIADSQMETENTPYNSSVDENGIYRNPSDVLAQQKETGITQDGDFVDGKDVTDNSSNVDENTV